MKDRYCDECGEMLEDWEEDICEECLNNFGSAIINTDGIWPNEDDF